MPEPLWCRGNFGVKSMESDPFIFPWYQAIGGDSYPGAVMGFGQDLFTGRVVGRLLKQAKSPRRRYKKHDRQGLQQRGADGEAQDFSAETDAILSRKDSRPFFFDHRNNLLDRQSRLSYNEKNKERVYGAYR